MGYGGIYIYITSWFSFIGSRWFRFIYLLPSILAERFFFDAFYFPFWKILVGEFFNFCRCFKHSFWWGWVMTLDPPQIVLFFFLCVFGGFLLKSHSNLLFLTPQIFDNGRVLPGSRLQVKTSRADEGPCVARLWLVQPWMLICSLVDPVPRSRLKKNWVKDWTRDTLHL